MECYAQKTATFMILGDICTRRCGFCHVAKGKTRPVDADEPRRVAAAVRQMGLAHVVITCVTRDDLPDGGAEHFVRTIHAVREASGATIEVLPSDFSGNGAAVDRVVDAFPQVYNHNTETVPRLYREVRGRKSDYAWTLAMFRPYQGPQSGHSHQERSDVGAGRDPRRVVGHALRPVGRGLRDAVARGSICGLRWSRCPWRVTLA